MLDNGWTDARICEELGMEPDELIRLKYITGWAKLFEDVEYQKAWETKRQIQIRKEWEKEHGSEGNTAERDKTVLENPRKISDEAVDAVAESIKRYGFNVPIVVDTKNVIISGHTRYKALMKLGYDTATCVVVDLPPEKAKEYRLVDNKTNELTEWDWDKLSIELRELEEQDIKNILP